MTPPVPASARPLSGRPLAARPLSGRLLLRPLLPGCGQLRRSPRALATASLLAVTILAPALSGRAAEALLAPPAAGTAAATPAAPVAPVALSPAAFSAALRGGDLQRLDEVCRQSVAEDRGDRLRRLRARLLELHRPPQPLAVILANAEVLLSCQQPDAALEVLNRIGPAPGAERVQWLVMQWRAATAGLDHRRAALALERLAAGSPQRLDALALPVQRRDDGTVVTRSALEVLASHLESRGLLADSAGLLLAGPPAGAAGAERLRQAAALLEGLPASQRQELLEAALDRAAAVGAWGLASELLEDQIQLGSERARERRLRLSPRLDDAYGEWQLRRNDPAAAGRTAELELQLRSPRAPGGHAPPAEESPRPAPVAGSPVTPQPTPVPAP